MTEFYTYIYLNPLKPGNFTYNDLSFDYEPFYIGKDKRLYAHLKGTKNKILFGTLRKIKKKNQEPIIFKYSDNLSEEHAFELEKLYIKNIGRRDLKLGPLANMTDGGDGVSGYRHTEEHKKENSKRNKGKKHTKAARHKMSEALKGKPKSDAHKLSLKKAAQNRTPISEETKKKLSKALTGRKVSDITRAKISKANKGRGGRCKTPEQLKQHGELIRISSSKPIIFRGEKYPSIKDTMKETNMSRYLILKEVVWL